MFYDNHKTYPPEHLKCDIRHNYGYDLCYMDEEIEAAIKEADCESDFYHWLDAAIKVERNRMRNTPEQTIDFEAVYKIEAGVFGKSPGFEMKLVITEGGESYTEYSGADVDVDWLRVYAKEIKQIPCLGEQVVEYVRTQNAEGKFPTRQEMVAALNSNKTDIHNALVQVQWHEQLLEPIPGPEERYKLTNGEPNDPATVFRRSDPAEKKRLLTTTTDVYSVKAMLATLTYSGPLSPSSNVPDALHQIMGDTPWPAVIGEAEELLSRELGNMWTYSGD
jgi:hypothetical protein